MTELQWQAYRAKQFLRRLREKVGMWIAWRLPREVVYWATIRLLAHATQGPYGNQVVPELKAMDALERWDGKR